jgi:hypothetical protein
MANSKEIPPPYVSFGIFKSTIELLAQSTVPSGPLDRRVLDGLSGADHGALMSGMRFLGLVDTDRKATQPYRTLVTASRDPGQFKKALLDLITTRYKDTVGNVDTAHGTASELEKAFRDAGVPPGQMLTKTVRFYIKALQECDVEVSPHILKAKRPATSPKKNGGDKTKKPRAAKRAPDFDEIPDAANYVSPEGFERLPIPGLVGAYIQYPSNLSTANCDLFDAMIGVLRTYVKGRIAEKEKKP